MCGISMGSLIPIFFSWAMEIIDDDAIASMLSLMSGFSSIVAAITTIIVGSIIEMTNLDFSIYIGIGLAVICIYIFSKNYSIINTLELENREEKLK